MEDMTTKARLQSQRDTAFPEFGIENEVPSTSSTVIYLDSYQTWLDAKDACASFAECCGSAQRDPHEQQVSDPHQHHDAPTTICGFSLFDKIAFLKAHFRYFRDRGLPCLSSYTRGVQASSTTTDPARIIQEVPNPLSHDFRNSDGNDSNDATEVKYTFENENGPTQMCMIPSRMSVKSSMATDGPVGPGIQLPHSPDVTDGPALYAGTQERYQRWFSGKPHRKSSTGSTAPMLDQLEP